MDIKTCTSMDTVNGMHGFQKSQTIIVFFFSVVLSTNSYTFLIFSEFVQNSTCRSLSKDEQKGRKPFSCAPKKFSLPITVKFCLGENWQFSKCRSTTGLKEFMLQP